MVASLVLSRGPFERGVVEEMDLAAVTVKAGVNLVVAVVYTAGMRASARNDIFVVRLVSICDSGIYLFVSSYALN